MNRYEEHFVKRRRQLFRFNENIYFDGRMKFSSFQKALERVQYVDIEGNEFH